MRTTIDLCHSKLHQHEFPELRESGSHRTQGTSRNVTCTTTSHDQGSTDYAGREDG